MEQVDQIIIVTLKDIGIDINTDEVTSLGKFTDQLIVQCVARCLNIINNNSPKLPEKLPDGMAMRYRVGIDLANACKKLGYKQDLGYETFLYSNEVEIRRLLMFLVENLPRARQDAAEEGHTTSSLRSSISNEIRRQLQLPWLPPECAKNHVIWDGNRKTGSYHYNGGFSRFSSENLVKEEWSQCLGVQCSQQKLLSSLLEMSSKLNQELSDLMFTKSENTYSSCTKEIFTKAFQDAKLSKDEAGRDLEITSSTTPSQETPEEQSIFQITESVLHGSKLSESSDNASPQEVDDTTDLIIQDHESAMKELNEAFELLDRKHDESKMKISNASKKLKDLEGSKKEKGAKLDQLKDEYLLKKKTLQLVPQEKEAGEAMREKILLVQKEMENVKGMWVSKESDLLAEAEQLDAELKSKELQTAEYVEDVRLMREEIVELVSSIETKEENHKRLDEQAMKLTSTINRNTHTKKILDIVDQIKRQKEHINSILSETKTVQKEINSLNGKIERSFIETDEIIFRDAKQNDQCRKSYKLLANLQSEFNALVGALDDIGTMNRELKDIEDLLQREKEKNTSEQITKVSKDLNAVIGENDKYIAAIKAAKSRKM